MEFDDARDDVVYGDGPEILQERAHPMPHGDGAWPDQLDVDISIVHELEMALLGVFQLFVGHLELATRRILRHRFREKLAKRRGRGHVTVNVDNFLSIVHKGSFYVGVNWLRNITKVERLHRHAGESRHP